MSDQREAFDGKVVDERKKERTNRRDEENLKHHVDTCCPFPKYI